MPREYPRAARLNTQLQRELTELIRDELTDPRIGQLTVTHVDCSPDMRNATVSVSSFGDDAQLRTAVKALGGAANRLRRVLSGRLRLRYTPQLRFVADMALREGDRISSLIRAATARDHEHPALAASNSEHPMGEDAKLAPLSAEKAHKDGADQS